MEARWKRVKLKKLHDKKRSKYITLENLSCVNNHKRRLQEYRRILKLRGRQEDHFEN